jgi:hypothetical protein
MTSGANLFFDFIGWAREGLVEGTSSPYSDSVNVPSGRPAVAVARGLDASPNTYSRHPSLPAPLLGLPSVLRTTPAGGTNGSSPRSSRSAFGFQLAEFFLGEVGTDRTAGSGLVLSVPSWRAGRTRRPHVQHRSRKAPPESEHRARPQANTSILIASCGTSRCSCPRNPERSAIHFIQRKQRPS